MNIKNRIEAFSALGDQFRQITNEAELSDLQKTAFRQAEAKNGWFTKENQIQAIQQWAKLLTIDNLNQWTSDYNQAKEPKTVAVIAAGNIPLVGFHDLLSVLISGHKLVFKSSSKDDVLFHWLRHSLMEINPDFKELFIIVDDFRENKFDAIIATGSNNSSRYFKEYFSKYPNIIRQNRTSIAVLNGEESDEDLRNLSRDIFEYYGLGCRNISKVFLPEGYKIDRLFESLYHHKDIINHHKYANNYDYYHAIYLLNGVDFLENGFVMIKEDDNLNSPISILFKKNYTTIDEVSDFVKQEEDNIQCIVSNFYEGALKFGEAQAPGLYDYADNIDVMEFLSKI